MGHLRGRVAAKVADTKGATIGVISQFMRANTLAFPWVDLSEVPILTEQAIQGATLIKYSQIVLSSLVTASTYPISHTISRQRISIPMEQAPPWRSSQVNELAILYYAKSAGTALTFCYEAVIRAENALDSFFGARWLFWQAKKSSRFRVSVASQLVTVLGTSAVRAKG
jgi:hypothetical protein